MDEGEDSMFKLNLINECDEQSINFAVERLNSKNNQVIYDTVIQVKDKFSFSHVLYKNSSNFTT